MPRRKTFPKFNSYEQASEWLDSHTTADLETTEVNFELASPLTIQILDSLSEVEETIVIEKELSQRIWQITKQKGLSAQDLVRKWLSEKVKESLSKK